MSKKNKSKLKMVTNNREYYTLLGDSIGKCPICRWNKGCNKKGRGRKPRNWKNYRNAQYKGW